MFVTASLLHIDNVIAVYLRIFTRFIYMNSHQFKTVTTHEGGWGKERRDSIISIPNETQAFNLQHGCNQPILILISIFKFGQPFDALSWRIRRTATVEHGVPPRIILIEDLPNEQVNAPALNLGTINLNKTLSARHF